MFAPPAGERLRHTPALRLPVPKLEELRSWSFALLAAGIWFEVLWRAAEVAPRARLSTAMAAAVGLTTQLFFVAIEASLGTAAWAALGRCVRWRTLAPALLTASVAEAGAVWVVSGAGGLPETMRVLLAGARGALEPASESALSRAFAGFGILALLRLLLGTCAHADSLRACPGPLLSNRRRWQDAAILVIAFYAASRLAIWWGLDLLRGRSFEP